MSHSPALCVEEGATRGEQLNESHRAATCREHERCDSVFNTLVEQLCVSVDGWHVRSFARGSVGRNDEARNISRAHDEQDVRMQDVQRCIKHLD